MPKVAASDALAELGRIYEQEIDYVWRTLERLGVRHADRADLAQEVFIVVHRKLHEYDRSRPLRPWLFGIAYRVMVGVKRRASGNEVLSDPEDEARAPSPESQTSASEHLDLAMRALHSIPLERRIVFIRHRIDGDSVVQIAEEMGIPLNTAYSRLRLAREDFTRAHAAILETPEKGEP